MKLISMTEFVLEQSEKLTQNNIPEATIETSHAMADSYLMMWNYANFLKQPLTLGMFVPCDEYGNVIIEPNKPELSGKKFKYHAGEWTYNEWQEQYQQAKEIVLFEGFEFKSMGGDQGKHYMIQIQEHVFTFMDGNITFLGFQHDHVEPLTTLGLTLSKSSQKQIGLCLD